MLRHIKLHRMRFLLLIGSRIQKLFVTGVKVLCETGPVDNRQLLRLEVALPSQARLCGGVPETSLASHGFQNGLHGTFLTSTLGSRWNFWTLSYLGRYLVTRFALWISRVTGVNHGCTMDACYDKMERVRCEFWGVCVADLALKINGLFISAQEVENSAHLIRTLAR